jgi:aspartate racemase
MSAEAVQMDIVPLKTIGLIGGTSGFATREYYRLLDEGVQAALGGHNAAELLLYSVNFENIKQFIKNGQWEDAGLYLAGKAVQLENGGADFILLVSNTLHRVAHQISQAVRIPFIDILDVTAKAIRDRGLRRPGMLGTLPVMTHEFFRDRYLQHGVELVSPSPEELVEVDRIIFDELCRGELAPASKGRYLEVIEGMRRRGAEGVVLGCTEISLLISQADIPDFPVFDTTTLHCGKAVELALS